MNNGNNNNIVPILFGNLIKNCRKRDQKLRILLDSGANESIIHAPLVNKTRISKTDLNEWKTMAGKFTTNCITKTVITLPELSNSAQFTIKAHVAEAKTNYDLIIGRDVLSQLGIILNFKERLITWNDAHVEMRTFDVNQQDHFFIQDSKPVQESTNRMKKILDAKYEKADLYEVTKGLKYLSTEKQAKLRKLLRKYEELFDGTLGKWKGKPYHIELKKGVEPYHAKPFPIPKAYEQTLRTEVERLIKLGVLKKVNISEWATPTFIIPKKDNTVRFISDFRELNKRIKRKPYPIPKIQDLLLKLEGFRYVTSLDLNMGYYHIKLDPFSKHLCTIVLPWGKYEYQALPMGLCNSPDIFQEKMSELIADLEHVRTYIDDLLVISNGTYEDHLIKLDKVLKRLREAGLKVNAKKSFFAESKLEYLGFLITRNGIMPLPKKVEALQNIAVPKNKKQLCSFIGLINYYRDMWIKRSEVLSPLTSMTSKEAKWNWTNECQMAFDTIKKIVSREVLLSYPDFSDTFEIHTDASKYQLGAVISQKGRPIAFYSRKLNSAQVNYTTTERELLSIVETLKEFRNILLGQKIRVYTDHKNLTYKSFNTERVMRWRLILEEFGPELHYIKGQKNIVADTLSRLDLTVNENSDNFDEPTKIFEQMAVTYAPENDDFPKEEHPISYKTIMAAQLKDKHLLKCSKTGDKNYSVKTFQGADKVRKLICYKDKIVISKSLQKRVVLWYHNHLQHPGETRTELCVKQHFY